MTPPRRRAALVVVAAVLAAASPAFAAWITTPTGAASGRADSVLSASTPSASAVGTTATVSWSATTLASGAPVTGYRVTRVDTVTAAAVPATGGCAGTLTTLSCVETGLTTGRWAYRVQAVRGGWAGPLGGPSPTLAVDATAPTVTAAVLAKSTGGLTGVIRQGGTYYLYANVADAGDPATGVTGVRADVSAITTGSASVALTAGTYTVGGVTYGWRTAQLTASNPVAAGTKAFTVTATDAAANSSAPQAASALVDNTRPAATTIDVTNGGATVGQAEAGDVVWFTTTETLDPQSVLAAWDGSATTVTVRLTNNGGGDRLQVRNAANTATLPLGTGFLTDRGYVTGTRDFTASSMLQIGNVIRITLGTPSGATGTVTTASTTTWTPSGTPYDAAGNTMLTTSVSELPPPDVQF